VKPTTSKEKTVTSNDESRPEQPAQPAETPQEAQRHWPSIVTELAHKAADGTVTGAAAWTAKRVLDKKFGGRGQDKGGGKPEPPSDPPPSQAE
jgi:hypothetical protein